MRRNLDLLAVGACVAVSLAIFAFVDDAFVRVVPALALVLFLPGYAASVCLFPASTLERLERLLLAVGISISLAVLAALVLDRTAHLTSRSWAGALAAATAVAVAGGILRRREPNVGVDSSPPLRIELGRLLLGSLVVAVAAACVVVAVALARLPAGTAQGSTILWARADRPVRGTYTLGLQSSELHTSTYVLTGDLAGKIVLRRTLTLRSGGTWQMTGSVGRSAGGSRVLHISLHRGSATAPVYRQVDLTFGAPGA